MNDNKQYKYDNNTCNRWSNLDHLDPIWIQMIQIAKDDTILDLTHLR